MLSGQGAKDCEDNEAERSMTSRGQFNGLPGTNGVPNDRFRDHEPPKDGHPVQDMSIFNSSSRYSSWPGLTNSFGPSCLRLDFPISSASRIRAFVRTLLYKR